MSRRFTSCPRRADMTYISVLGEDCILQPCSEAWSVSPVWQIWPTCARSVLHPSTIPSGWPASPGVPDMTYSVLRESCIHQPCPAGSPAHNVWQIWPTCAWRELHSSAMASCTLYGRYDLSTLAELYPSAVANKLTSSTMYGRYDPPALGENYIHQPWPAGWPAHPSSCWGLAWAAHTHL